jgi:hypothetical protein
MAFKWNPITGMLDIAGSGGTVDYIESSKILPMSGSILAGQTKVVDSMSYTGFFAIRYFVAVQSSDNKTNSFDYTIANNGIGGVKESIFGAIFGGLPLDTLTYVDTGIVKFSITNNHLYDVIYKVHKLGF